MRVASILSLVFASSLVVACSGDNGSSTTDDGGTNDGGGTTDGGTTDGGATDGGTTDGGTTDGGGADGGVLNCANAKPVVLTIGSCSTLTACGGDPTGTWNYTQGCLADPFAQAKKTCQALNVTQQTATVQGCIQFAGNLVGRNVKVSYSASATFPLACALGDCANAETALKGYFQTATCTKSTTECNCTVASTYTTTGGDTYSTANNQIVTGAGDHYDFCVNGTSLGYSHVSGSAQEPGNYTLTKQ